jgi:Ser-tRNA(Ala) deacylase AlaX
VVSVEPFTELPEAEQALFKQLLETAAACQVVVTEETIFYPQGGGQRSDVGNMQSVSGMSTFSVLHVRNAPQKRTLHLGTFSPAGAAFAAGEEVLQSIDGVKRLLYSRLHTAGHVLGLAVAELGPLIPDVVDTKAQHYPEAAYVEFRGLIDGKHKDAIQAKTDELVERRLPVKLHWWDMDELHAKCRAVLDGFTLPEGEKARAVEIEGIGAYPCGGTHVEDSSGVGKIVVGKIKRAKGMTKISYTVEPAE